MYLSAHISSVSFIFRLEKSPRDWVRWPWSSKPGRRRWYLTYSGCKWNKRSKQSPAALARNSFSWENSTVANTWLLQLIDSHSFSHSRHSTNFSNKDPRLPILSWLVSSYSWWRKQPKIWETTVLKHNMLRNCERNWRMSIYPTCRGCFVFIDCSLFGPMKSGWLHHCFKGTEARGTVASRSRFSLDITRICCFHRTAGATSTYFISKDSAHYHNIKAILINYIIICTFYLFPIINHFSKLLTKAASS